MTSLSQSELWSHMEDYYEQLGVEVWQDEVVPLDITSNVYLANLYARLIIAAINDYNIAHPNASVEPFHLIEMGVGHGKFSFYLLKRLLEGFEVYDIPASSIKYIMTDISPKNIESWQNNVAFKPFLEKGILDFALYNALEEDALHLTVGKDVINKGDLTKPIFVVANYLFDSLPHDAFQIKDGELNEAQLDIKQKKKGVSSSNIKDYFESSAFEFTYNKVSPNYYKNNPELNEVLKFYTDTFLEASFTLPIGGVECIQNIQGFTKSALVLFLADKAIANSDFFEGLENPDITIHGSVSMTVNFDALAHYTQHMKGLPLLMDNQNADFQVGCLIFNQKYNMHNTQYAFKSSLSAFSPVDLYSLCYSGDMDKTNESLESLDEYLALLNLAEWDPNIFYDYHEQIIKIIEDEEASPEQEAGLIIGVKKVWDYFFHLEKNRDIPFALGCILYEIDEYEDCAFYFERSLALFGESGETYLNLALAYQGLEENNKAIEAAQKALSMDKSLSDAQDIINELMPN